ncbi:MAG: carboxypeptidase-like regulatory domain-containing protein, partial [Acidobacteria bacterium]|nr:carboxypeptidase-like regulatory domain-containing protein [Acidobacteriota bacterium]
MNAEQSTRLALRIHSWWFATLVWTVVTASPILFGQAFTSLSGTVTDPTGAVVPGITVILESADKGTKRETTTDENGRYSFAQVLPGTYQMTAKAAGFRDVAVKEFRLLVNSPATVNIAFETVGTIAEALTVTAQTAQVNTTDASLGNAISTQAITQLPLLLRNPVGLLGYQPGVTAFTDGGGEINGAVNGGKNDQANITLDGVDVNDQNERRAFTSVLRVTLDSVQEFRTTTANANADQGRSAGGQIALVTKSGSNEFHGAVYDYHRNTATAANSFFNNLSGVKKPALLIDVFGGSFGGPIKKNRLFFFANYEGRRDRSGTSQLVTVPSAKLRQGIVQYVRTDGTIADLTPQDIQTRIDPLGIGVNSAVLKLFQSYPLPNDFTQGDGLNILGYRFASPQRSKEDTYISRLDYTVDAASKHLLFWRGNLQNDHSGGVPQFPGDIPRSVGLNNSKGMVLGYNWILKPTLISTLRYGYTRAGTENTGIQTLPAVSFTGISNRNALTTGSRRIIPVHQATEDLAWTRGAHDVRLGGVFRWIRNSRSAPAPFHSGLIRANRLQGQGSELAAAVPDLSGSRGPFIDAMASVLGLISSVTSNYTYDIQGNVVPVSAQVRRVMANNEYEFYIQDSWKITHAFTLTAGLRYSLMPPVYEATGAQTSTTFPLGEWFDRRGGLAQQGRPQSEAGQITFISQEDPRWRPLYRYHKKNFAPRLALAYSPQASEGWLKWLTGGPGKSSIRAGWGMFYDLIGQPLANQFIFSQFGFSTNLTNPSGVLTA